MHAQSKIGTLDDLRWARADCYDATVSDAVDRDLLADRGWTPVTLVSKDGARRPSDAIFSHSINPGWIVTPPGEGYCIARIQFAEGEPLDEFLEEVEQYRPEKQDGKKYYFCTDGRTASLEQRARQNGPMIAAYFSTPVDSGRCFAG